MHPGAVPANIRTVFGRLDRYVTQNVLGAWVMCNVFFVLLFILVDLLVGLSDLAKAIEKDSLSLLEVVQLLARYYVLFLPVVFVTVGPFVTVISSMFAISRLMSANEVVPMLFTGRSVYRVLSPALACAGLSALLMGVVWEYAIPHVREELSQVREVLESGKPRRDENIVVKIREDAADGRSAQHDTLFARAYEPDRFRLIDVVVVRRGVLAEDEVKLEARAADWDPEREDWDLTNGWTRMARGGSPLDRLGVSGLSPDRVRQSLMESKEIGALSYSQLLELQRDHPERAEYRLAFHAHVTFPLANFVLLMLVLPFAVTFERRSRIERVVVSIVVCAAYLITDLTCQRMGSAGYLDPTFAAWLPTIVFGSLGVTLVTGVRT